MNMDNYATKTRMVLYALEKSLGEYVKSRGNLENISEQLIQQIANRETRAGREFDENSLEDIVGASYFDEAFELAIQSSFNTSDEDLLNKLRTLSVDVGLIKIRNAVSHSNRDYKLSYWYTSAFIASNPLIESLNFEKVSKALLSAENNELIEPPKEWMMLATNEIGNNLPHYFEHDLTGLVGRQKEAKELKKLILNRRVNTISVVAPGGVGKTALVLDFLNNFAYTHEAADNYNGIIFVSLKTEELTTSGIKNLSAVESIEELKDAILDAFNDIWDKEYNTFEELINSKNEYKPLIFIDNLETLIRDSESIFSDFNSSLPYDWKVLITSRINVSDASTLPLSTLKQDAAAHLVREYIKSKGLQILCNEQVIELTKACNFNPLAIKLSIDYWALGNELPKALQQANTGIAEYSFKNLISTLNENSIEVLELLFTVVRCSRREICNLLGINVDESAKAISELSKTSLIKKISDSDFEYYEINSSIRDFLLLNPKNIQVRKKVQNNIKLNKDRAIEITNQQNRKNISEYDELYIPEDSQETLRICVSKVNKVCMKYARSKNTDDLSAVSEIYSEMKELESNYKNDYLFQRTYAKVLRLMHDSINEKKALLKAVSLNPKDVVSNISLAKHYHEQREYNPSEKIYTKLYTRNELKQHKKTWYSILNGYFLSLLYQGKYDDVFSLTKKWKDDHEYSATLGTYRASAYKRKMEVLLEQGNTNEIHQTFNSALKIMHTVLKESGYFFVACREALKIIDAILHYFSTKRSSYTPAQSKAAIQLLEFCNIHIEEISNTIKSEKSELRDLVRELKQIPVNNNPFNSKKWIITRSPCEEHGVNFDKLDSKFVLTRVHNIPSENGYQKPFIFTEDGYNKRCFVHKSAFKNMNPQLFYSLSRGDSIALIPRKEKGKELETANEAYLVKV